ncbi:MAG: putative quinol monooxygenase [Chloroflexota bacterium]
MITFLVRCRLRDDDDAQTAAEDIIAGVVAATEGEPGAVSYNFYRNSNDKRELVLVESYVDNDAFLRHNMSPYMIAFRERFAELFDVSTNRVELLEQIAGFGRTTAARVEASVGSGG